MTLIKIETNPFRKQKQRFKMRTVRMQNGTPVSTGDGRLVYHLEEPRNLTRIPGTVTTLAAGRLPSGEINTGLNELIDNPYIDEVTYTQEWGARILKGRAKVKRQHVLEYKHGQPFDFYTGRISMEPKASNSEKVFFEKEESKIQMKDNTCFLDLNNPIDEVRYYVLKAHPSIANSLAELEGGGNLDAQWYIVDEFEKQQFRVSKIDMEMNASAALKALSDAGTETLVVMCKALELDEAGSAALTGDTAKRAIYDYYNQNEDTYNAFMSMYNMWKEQATRPYVVSAAHLYDFIKLGIVVYRAGKYSWISPSAEGKPSETYLRNSKREFIDNFMLDAHYQDQLEIMHNVYRDKTRKH